MIEIRNESFTVEKEAQNIQNPMIRDSFVHLRLQKL